MCFGFSLSNFKININENCVKYLQGISFSQLIFPEQRGIKNLNRATRDLVVSHSSSSRIQTYVRNYNRAIYTKRK